MNGIWPELALVAALIVVNALLAGTEIALISLREPKLTQMEEAGGSAAVASRLARNPNRFLATIQIGITLAGFLASAVKMTLPLEPRSSRYWPSSSKPIVTDFWFCETGV